MNILFDHQAFIIQNYGGISRYYYELISRFDKKEAYPMISLFCSNNVYANDIVNSKIDFLKSINFKGKNTIINTLNIINSKKNIKKENFDIFHPTYYDNYYNCNLINKPIVVTFHDMIHEKFGHEFNNLSYDKKIIKNKLKLQKIASKIITVSENTKKDLIEIYGTPSDKISVIHLGNSLKLNYIDANDSPHISKPYVLFVGTRTGYKNFKFLLYSIYEILLSENILCICAGGGSFSIDEISLINSLNLKHHVYQIPINDKILKNLYRNSLAFIFPSLYEGFGITVLEAFGCSCPCILSEDGSLKEVAGEAAIYFNPRDNFSLKEALVKLMSDTSKRNQLIKKGLQQLNLYSWDKTFQETYSIYEDILKCK
jgi:glycosyltransferase involved in cell wall biosynthesis